MCGERNDLACIVTGFHSDYVNATQRYIVLAAYCLSLLPLPDMKLQLCYSSYLKIRVFSFSVVARFDISNTTLKVI
jgi:hypothetical protein